MRSPIPFFTVLSLTLHAASASAVWTTLVGEPESSPIRVSVIEEGRVQEGESLVPREHATGRPAGDRLQRWQADRESERTKIAAQKGRLERAQAARVRAQKVLNRARATARRATEAETTTRDLAVISGANLRVESGPWAQAEARRLEALGAHERVTAESVRAAELAREAQAAAATDREKVAANTESARANAAERHVEAATKALAEATLAAEALALDLEPARKAAEADAERLAAAEAERAAANAAVAEAAQELAAAKAAEARASSALASAKKKATLAASASIKVPGSGSEGDEGGAAERTPGEEAAGGRQPGHGGEDAAGTVAGERSRAPRAGRPDGAGEAQKTADIADSGSNGPVAPPGEGTLEPGSNGPLADAAERLENVGPDGPMPPAGDGTLDPARPDNPATEAPIPPTPVTAAASDPAEPSDDPAAPDPDATLLAASPRRALSGSGPKIAGAPAARGTPTLYFVRGDGVLITGSWDPTAAFIGTQTIAVPVATRAPTAIAAAAAPPPAPHPAPPATRLRLPDLNPGPPADDGFRLTLWDEGADAPPAPTRQKPPAVPTGRRAPAATLVTVATPPPLPPPEAPVASLAVLPDDIPEGVTTAISVSAHPLAPWMTTVDDALRARWHYPAELRAMGLEGTVEIAFFVLPSGKVVQTTVLSSRGHADLVFASLASVPVTVEPPPAGWGRVEVRYTFRYRAAPRGTQ